MNNPHVESLTYKLVESEEHKYNNPPSLNIIQDKWEGVLENGILTCTMKEHFSDTASAKAEVNRYLQAWEVYTSLTFNYGMLKFLFQNADIIDLEPDPPGSATIINLPVASMEMTALAPQILLTHSKYPDLPGLFRVSPDVEILVKRYEFYIEGRELLASMAYFCLTVVEHQFGNGQRRASAGNLCVSFEVLDTLGKLVSSKGDYTTARKFLGQSKMVPLSGTERSWIEAVIKRLIIRVGEIDNRANLPQIRMSDFTRH